MFGSKEYISLTLNEQVIKVAKVKVAGGKLHLLKLDEYSLIEPIKTNAGARNIFDEASSKPKEDDTEADEIFGLEEDEDIDTLSDDIEEELNLDDFEEEPEEDLTSLDMVEEAEAGQSQSNEILLYNILSDLSPKQANVILNIPPGNAIFQIIRDTDFSGVKQKDLEEDIEEKLYSIYGEQKSSDNYAYEVREDGSLLLCSVEQEAAMLQLLNRAQEFYAGKLKVQGIYPDEAALVGLVRANYDLQPSEVTAVVQFRPTKCRIVFMSGEDIWSVSPIINEGIKSKSLLNTIFSKILFQLDTGEVPSLDRIILCNNTIGQEANYFLENHFSDVLVENFHFDEEKFDFGGIEPHITHSFTTSIAVAWAGSDFKKEHFPNLSLLPQYVEDRQKIFKLQWHGIVLLALIFLAPLTFNYFYQKNVAKIESLTNELSQLNRQITQINPVVQRTNEISQNLQILREKLVRLDNLSQGSREWSAKLDILNEGTDDIANTWLTSMNQTQDAVIYEGYTLYRNRIPNLVNVFNEGTLLSVIIEEIREQEVFRFSVMVKEYAESESVYSLPRPEEFKEIVNANR